MKEIDMTEQAYRNGYAKGYADAKKNEKHGRWEYHDCVNTGDGMKAVYACSVCGACIDEEVFDGMYHTEYCPHCGNPMDLPNITENTRKALEKMGENVHSEIDFDYAAED